MTHTAEELQSLGFHNTNVSGRFYLGLNNQKLLQDQGFNSTQRLTLKQVQGLGLELKQDQNPVTVIYKDMVEYEETNDDGNKETKVKPYLRYHDVYNIEQTYDPSGELQTPELIQKQESDKPTPKQLSYLSRLIKKRYYDPGMRRDKMREIYQMSKQEASHTIQELATA